MPLTLKQVADQANPNTLPDLLRKLKFGQILEGGIPIFKRRLNMDALGVNQGNLATLDAYEPPDGQRGAAVLRATVRAGAVTGELTPVAFGVTPATTQIAVAPNGNIVTLAADAITDMDLVYVADKVDVLELVLPVIPGTGVCALPASMTTPGVVFLEEAQSIAGTLLRDMIVLVPAAGAPATTQARLLSLIHI